MVSDKVFTTDGTSTIYSADFKIISDNHCNVYIDTVLQSRTTYDIINNAAVFTTAPATGKTLIVQVGTTPDDLLTNPTDAGIVAANIANVNAVGSNIADVTSVADNMAEVLTADTNAAAAAASAIAAQSSEDDAAADLVLTNADVVLTHADVVLTHADVILAEADKVQTGLDLVATNQDTIDTAADLVATNQDTIDTAADVVLTNQDTIDTAADVVLTHADVVLTHADVVLTNADVTTTGNALTAAQSAQTAAETAETNAETAETNAAASASSILGAVTATAADVVTTAGYAASAAATFDNFDDRYLGSQATAPILDNDGDALIVGALYFDTVEQVMKVNTAFGWVATSSATLATMERFVFTATAAQTVFSGTDDGGDTLVIIAGAEIVTLNGIVLEVTADYTVTTSSITLLSGATLNDDLNVYAFGNFELADHYSKVAADARYAAISVVNYDASTIQAEVDLNTAKTGITSSQASAITANTAKVGITSSQASAITANTAKVGITSSQASAITANTAKVTNATHTGDVTGDTTLTIATDAVDIAMLSATGTASSSTYLRGDNTWGTVSTDPTMGGDMSGTASNAQLVANAVGSTEIANGAVIDAKIGTMSSSKLTGALPAIDGSSLTGVSGAFNSSYNWASASRNRSTTYTNSSGGPIWMSVPRGGGGETITIKGVTQSGHNSSQSATLLVPEGATYRFNTPVSSWYIVSL